MLDGMEIYSNILHNEGDNIWGGVINLADNSSKNVDIFNNLLISTTVSTCLTLPKDNYIGIQVRNNIIMRSRVDASNQTLISISPDALANVELKNNIYFNNGPANVYEISGGANYTTLAELQLDYPTVEIGSIETNPMITDIPTYEYSLLAGSPAIRFGNQTPNDFYGGSSSTDAGPIAFGTETSDRFYIDKDALKMLHPILKGNKRIDVVSTDSTGLSLEKRFEIIVSNGD